MLQNGLLSYQVKIITIIFCVVSGEKKTGPPLPHMQHFVSV
jgi:hypothetical protein